MTPVPRPMAVDPALLQRHSISVPRYTSYPTVPEWKDTFDAGAILEHYGAQASSAPISLYVHVPFCARLCLYCGCNIVITQDRGRASRYLKAVERELETVSKTALGARPVAQLHWGGGTPTFLNEDELTALYVAIQSRFRLAEDAEIGIEVDPRETPPAKARHLARLGFNRLSMGVQDFDAETQEAVQRVQPFDMTKATLDAARDAGIGGINIDLMYGLPHQTLDRFMRTLDQVLELKPDRLALFHYAHLPDMIRHQRAIDEAALPDAFEKFRIFAEAVRRLTGAGYEYIGLDHFAVPDDELAVARRGGTIHRNFQGYTTSAGADLVGFGVSAISNVAGVYVQNKKDLGEYESAVATGGAAPWRGIRMSEDDRVRRDVIERLMCKGVLRKADVDAKWGICFDEYFADALRDLEQDAADGLLHMSTDGLRLTELGVVLMRNVARRFDAYLRGKPAPSRFSRSV